MSIASSLFGSRFVAARLLFGLTLSVLFFAGCDQAPGVDAPGGDPPALTQFDFSPHAISLGDPGVEESGDQAVFSVEMSVQVDDPDGDLADVRYVVQSPYAGRQPVAEGSLTPQSRGSIFTGKATIRVPKGDVGVYTVLVYAVDETGSLSDNVRGMLRFGGQGEPPVILNVAAPDTVQRPATGEPAKVLMLAATVSDPDGASTVSSVVFWNVVRPTAVIEMADDGVRFGDEVANDGTFTRTVQIESGNEPGTTVLAFQATDRSGLKSNVVEKTIVVE